MTLLSVRLKALRKQNAYSLEQLAQRAGLTKSYLSKLERGLAEPSISTVLKLSEAYQISVGQLIGDDASTLDESVTVVRVADRRHFHREGASTDYRYQSLAGRRTVRKMEPFVVHLPQEYTTETQLSPHKGEEFMVVLKGEVEVQIGERVEQLQVGDAVYFDSELPHRMRSISTEIAEVLIVASH